MRWCGVCLLGILGWQLAIGPAFAEEPQTLTLKAAREMALRNHPKISQANLEAQASKQVITQVRAGLLPTLTFDATAVGTADDNTRIAAGSLNNPAIYERFAQGVTVSQLLLDFGHTSNLLGSSKLSSKAEDSNAEATKDQILLDVDVAFYTALKAQSILAVARQTLDTRKVLLEQVDALARNKLKSDLDLSFATVAYEEAKLLVAKSENDVEAAFTALSTLLGDREQHEYRLVEEPMPDAQPVDSSVLVDTALSKRPDLASLRFERDAAMRYAKAERALIFPVITAFGSGGIIPVRDNNQFDASYAAAGVNLSLPIFDGWLNSAKYSEADLRAQAAAEKLRDAENSAARDVQTASLNATYAFERLDLTQQLFDNANHAYELADLRYKLGSSSIVELSQAQLNKTEAEIAHTSAKYDYQIQRAILEYQIGESTAE
ncbi:MAG TPA: TolC family protein [Nitrospiria bacterium]|nr:TolC family protein [Nitrospiria bacterium]